MAEKQRPDIATLFLKEFTRQLIIKSKPKIQPDKEAIERVKVRLGLQAPQQDIAKLPVKETIPIAQKPIPPRPLKQLPRRMPLIRPGMRLPQRPAIPFQKAPQVQQKPQQSQKEQINLGKLKQLLSDKGVTGVECPGPDKNVLINRSGLIQTAQFALSKEEIDSILNDFSQKTKIPLIPGIFKALYDNLLLTAVISEAAGNRFIIEKHFGQPSLPQKESK